MNRRTKIIIAIFASASLVCISVCVLGLLALRQAGSTAAGQMSVTDPAQISALAREIIDYDLPPDYREETYINFIFGKMLMLQADSTTRDVSLKPFIMITQMPRSITRIDKAGMRRQLQLSVERAMGRGNYRMDLVDQRTATIRGQAVNLYLYEGTDDQGIKTRFLLSDAFDGKSGSLLLLITGPSEGWDQAELEAFIASIR
jgi:hypothetical protein